MQQYNGMVDIIISLLLEPNIREAEGNVEHEGGKKAWYVSKYKKHPLILFVSEPLHTYKRVNRLIIKAVKCEHISA